MTCDKVTIAFFTWVEAGNTNFACHAMRQGCDHIFCMRWGRQHKFRIPWHAARSWKQILYAYLITCERTMFDLSFRVFDCPNFCLSFSWLETNTHPGVNFYHVLIGRELWGWEVRKTNQIAPPRDAWGSLLAENKNTRIWLAELKWMGRTDGRTDGWTDGPPFEVFWTSHYTQP